MPIILLCVCFSHAAPHNPIFSPEALAPTLTAPDPLYARGLPFDIKTDTPNAAPIPPADPTSPQTSFQTETVVVPGDIGIVVPFASYEHYPNDDTPDDWPVIDAPFNGAVPTVNTATVLYCLDDSSFTYKLGFQITFYDATAQRSEGVQFFTAGPPYWVGYIFFKKHTNSNGFWENADIFGSNPGVNIGFNPTGKSMNFGYRPHTDLDYGTMQKQCQDVFHIEPPAHSNSFSSVFSQDLPSLFTADA